VVKGIRPDYSGRVNFIHIEVYENLKEPQNLKVVKAVEEWNLPSEPWVFVVDSQGRVAAKFEGVLTTEELQAALKAVIQAG